MERKKKKLVKFLEIDEVKKFEQPLVDKTKEALSNIVKHSDGKKVSVQLLEHPGFYQLVVEDNGRQSKNGDKNGMGIETMEERVKALGGTFLSQRERGYRICVSIPKRMERNGYTKERVRLLGRCN